MAYKVEPVSPDSCISILGEGPHWDADSQSLYYNDIYGTEASILRFDYKEGKTYSAKIDGEPVVSFIIPVEGTTDQFAVGIGRRVGVVQWDGKSPKAQLVRVAFEVEPEAKFVNNRFNDAKADPKGRFYGGTMRLEECGDLFEAPNGTFYSYSKGEQPKRLRENVYISNGLAWNEKTNKFYYIDSCQLDVKEFDWDPNTGDISNERQVIDFRVNGERPGFVPDGMTIDTDGYLYVATWGGSKVLKINPATGKVELDIRFPCDQVTSAAWGGPNLDILYVTTAATERDHPQPKPAGQLFKVTGLGARGFAGVKTRV